MEYPQQGFVGVSVGGALAQQSWTSYGAGADVQQSSPVNGSLMRSVKHAEELFAALSELANRLTPALNYPPPQGHASANKPAEGGSPLETALNEHADKIASAGAIVRDLNARLRL